MSSTPAPHIEALLKRDLDIIRGKLLEMSALDEVALTHAFDAFLRRDRQLAYSVILRDQEIDAFETELDRLCLEFITRHQPAAGHLRFVYSASKVVSQLERVGDYAESVARQVLLLSSIPFENITERFREIADLSIVMLRDAVRAFVDKDEALARTTMLNEPRVNHCRDMLSADLIRFREDGSLPLEALTPLITVARRFERVSDQATNICEEAVYFATGQYFRHAQRVGFRVVFLDETHGCLSRLAEAAGNQFDGRRFSFESAGIAPVPLDPDTASIMKDRAIDTSRDPGKPLTGVPQIEQVQVIIALSKEAEAKIPHGLSKALILRWSVADPSQVRGTPEQVQTAYDRAFEFLTTHIRDLVQAILGSE